MRKCIYGQDTWLKGPAALDVGSVYSGVGRVIQNCATQAAVQAAGPLNPDNGTLSQVCMSSPLAQVL